MLTFAISSIQADLSREAQRCRLLRHARRRCGQERPDGLDAGRAVYPQDRRAPDEAKKFVAFVASVPGCDIRRPRPVGRPDPTWSRAARCPATCRRRSPTCCPISRRKTASRRRSSSCRRSRDRRSSRSRSKSAPGIRPPADGAALYDEDVKKQAQQLGLPAGKLRHASRDRPARLTISGRAGSSWREPWPLRQPPPRSGPRRRREGAAAPCAATRTGSTCRPRSSTACFSSFPTLASLFFSLTRWTLFDFDLHRPRQFRPVLPRAVPRSGPDQHPDLRRRDVRR